MKHLTIVLEFDDEAELPSVMGINQLLGGQVVAFSHCNVIEEERRCRMDSNTEERRITADSDTLDLVYAELLDGLLVDGSHHKQHHLEQALRLLVGNDVDVLRQMMQWHGGIPS